MSLDTKEHPHSGKKMAVGLAVGVLGVMFLLPSASTPTGSSELAFTDHIQDGLHVIPASCPSNIHFVGECAPPNDSPSLSIASAGACIVGQPFLLNITGGDPEGQDLIYTITLDDTQTISRGPTPSGTTETVSWAFSSPGTHTVKVSAIDAAGARSPTILSTFTCSENESTATGVLDDVDGGIHSPNIEEWILDVDPQLVRSGETTRVFWETEGVDSCKVFGTNGDEFDGTQGPADGEESGPIFEKTFYTLVCQTGGGEGTAGPVVVNVVPIWQEI